MDDSVYDVPEGSAESVFGSPPPALPPKLSSESFKEKEKLLSANLPTNKPVPKPRRNVSGGRTSLSPTGTSPTSRPVPRPRPRTMSKDKIFSEESETPRSFETSLDNVQLPPDAEEAAKMIEDMVEAKFSSPHPVNKNPIYDFEEFVGNRQSKEGPDQTVLKPLVVDNDAKILSPVITDQGHVADQLDNITSDDIYTNIESVHGLSRSDPDGATEPSNNTDSMYPMSDTKTLHQQPDDDVYMNDDQLFGSGRWPEGSLQQNQGIIPDVIPDVLHGGVSSAKSDAGTLEGKLASQLYVNDASAVHKADVADDDEVEDESMYEPVWMGQKKGPPPPKKPSTNDLMNFSPKQEPTPLMFVPGKSSNVVQAFPDESTTDDLVPKLNITERWGEYVGLDPRASLVYEQPPPMHAPPPLPPDAQRIAGAPPVPPRPSPTMSTPDRSSDKSVVKPSPSEVFSNLETPKPAAFDDDPFKYSDFATECKHFNKEGTAAKESWPSANSDQGAQDDMFDPFGLGIQNYQPSSSSQWATKAASASTSSSTSAGSSGPPNRISLSHVPPPPNQLYAKVNKHTQPREDFYSMAQEMEPSLDSSDSSDEPFSTDTMLDGRSRISDSSSGLSTMSGHSTGASVPIIAGQTAQKKTERYGYLYKQGGVKANKGWRRRWVVFNGRDLRYYVNNKSQISKRVIPLSCMKKVENDVRDGDTTRFKFRLLTTLKDRVFVFASDTLEDCLIWTQTLMAAIALYERNNNHLDNGEEAMMENPDKEGYIKFENGGRKYYVCIRGSVLCYYNNIEDFRMSSPVHEISMELASVKDVARCKLQLSTHYAYFILGFDSAGEAQQWKMAIEDAIAEGLADDSVLQKVYENDSNRLCADCEALDPHWASINLGIVVCKKCAGIHRMFEAGISKIRSLRMDTRVWTPSLIELMKAIGNANANHFWEFEMLHDVKINPDSSSELRKNFISNKYKNKRYCHTSSKDVRLLNEELLEVARTDDLMELVKIFFSGANIQYHRHGFPNETAYQISKASGKRLLMEFLYQNGGDSSSSDSENNEGRLREDVRHQGYLFKTGPNNRSFDKRWCVLEHGAVSYYLTDKSTTAKDSIERQCIYSIHETSGERQKFAFEISTNKGNNRVYLFAAEDGGERGMWLRSIGKVVCPVAIMEHVGMMDFSFGGNYYVKNIVTEDWHKTWVMLSWRLLYYMDQNLKLEWIDLRHAISIKYQEADRGCSQCAEPGQHFVINAPNKALYIQADLIRDTEKAYAACEMAIKESGKTLQDQQLTSDEVPIIVDRCINHINQTGLTSQGIYRESAQQSRIQSLLTELRKDARTVKLDDYTSNEVANALKRFFRELDDSVFTKDAYSHWIGTAGAIHDYNQKLNWYRYLLEKLPTINYNTLKRLVHHLHRVSQHTNENRMTRENLATCFAPSLMRTDNSEGGGGGSIGGTLALEMAVLTDIINCHEELLPVQEHQKKIEEKIAEAEAEISRVTRKTQRMSTVIDRMITTIHMYSGEGQCITLPIGHSDATEMVVKAVKDKNNLQGQFMLTEILLKGSLERPLPLTEAVLPVTTSWGNLGQDICSDAKLCVKTLDLLEKLQMALDQTQILFGEIRFSDKKKFSKHVFQFKQGKLVCFRDSKAKNQLHSWNVEDLIIYLGIDPRRQPGTKTPYGLTFVMKGEKCNKDYLGRSLLFGSEQEMMKWASALIVAQYPDGIYASFS